MTKNAYCGFTVKVQSGRKGRSPSKKSQGRPQETGKIVTVWFTNVYGIQGEVCQIPISGTFAAARKKIGPAVQKMGLHFPVAKVEGDGVTFVPVKVIKGYKVRVCEPKDPKKFGYEAEVYEILQNGGMSKVDQTYIRGTLEAIAIALEYDERLNIPPGIILKERGVTTIHC